jgi:HSP20 family protein
MASFMDSLWDSVWFQDQGAGATSDFNSHVFDIVEHPDRFEFRVAYPGATDVNIMVEDDILSMKMTREEEEVADTVKYHVKGINNYSFNKRLSLAKVSVEQEKISSSYKKGILTIVMPKSEAAKPSVIAVKVDE